MKNQVSFLLLSLLSGLLLFAAWPSYGLPLFLFVGFVPLLVLEQKALERQLPNGKVFAWAYIAFLVWNVGSTWWVYKASLAGGVLAFVFNTLFMAIVFLLFHITRKRLGDRAGYLSLIAYWLGFEYLHLQWQLSWPWLTLGNGFASAYKWVQWYEYTGVFGGGLWVLLANIFIFRLLKGWMEHKMLNKSLLTGVLALIFLPIAISLLMYSRYEEKGRSVGVVITQPNVDPYNEKFTSMPAEEQLARMLRLAATMVDSNTEYVVGPETALPYDHREEYIQDDQDVKTIRAFIKPYPKMKFVVGVSSSRVFKPGEALSSSARHRGNEYYDEYNTSMQVSNDGKIQLYHKSKLVPGVEQMPYPGIFRFVESFAIDLGGTVGSYGTQEDRTVFTSNEGLSVGAPICYESIYGEFLSGYIHNGAAFIFIITNDGWWGDTPGYKQHNEYARLRAIEFRRSIARSANTGISSFINQRGDMLSATKWWEPAVLKESLHANTEITFYVKHGDYIAKFCSVIAIGLLLFIFATRFLKRKTL